MRARSILSSLLVAALLGCGGSKPAVDTLPTQEGEWIKARREYEKGHYVRAVEKLTAFTEAHPGSNRLDEVLLLLGLSHIKTGENLLAVEDFNRLIRDFPQSPLREEAEYRRAESYLNEALSPPKDPEATETALNLLRTYLMRYPSGRFVEEARAGVEDCLERLATKAFLNAETYLRLRRDRAAVIYLEKALQTKPDFRRAGAAWAYLARAQERLGELAQARNAWKELLVYATPERLGRDADLREFRQEALEALRRLPKEEEAGKEAP